MLKTIKLSNNLKYIGNYSLYRTKIKNITLPKSINNKVISFGLEHLKKLMTSRNVMNKVDFDDDDIGNLLVDKFTC